MFKPNPVELELPYEEGLFLQLHREWIAECKMAGTRAVLESGVLKTFRANIAPPGLLPSDWQFHTLDGCLVGRVYYLFDVLMLNGEDVRKRPLYERRTLLRSLKLPAWCRLVPCGKNIGEFLEAVVRDGGKGVILKSLLESYDEAQWIKVECPEVQEVVIKAVEQATMSAQVAQFQQGKLVDCGVVFLGSSVVQAEVGQVIEVDMRGSTTRSGDGQPKFLRFRSDSITLDADASGKAAEVAPGKFIRLRPRKLSAHSTTSIHSVS